jgi:tape measure domain-containing protein
MTGIIIESRADTLQAQKEINKLSESLKNTEEQANKAGLAISAAFKVIGIISSVAIFTKQIRGISNEFSHLENRVATVTGRTKELLATQQDLFDLSKKTKSSIRDSTELYASMGLALRSMNLESERLVKVTGTIQKAITLSGASKAASQAAIIQLGQGLSAGVLRGDELRSVIEQTPRLALAIADSMNTTIGGLRRLGAEGKITSDIVFNALIQQAGKINKEFESIKPTLEQASTAFGESIRLYINEFGKGLGIFDKMADNSFKMAERIKNAAENAYNLGNQFRVAFLVIKRNVSEISRPLLNILKEFSINFLAMLPQFALTRTLRNDAIRALRWLDNNFFFGLWTRWRRWQAMSLFMIESDLEKALRRLRRLNPRYLIGGGFNRATLEEIFSMDYVRQYGEVLGDVAIAIRKNRESLGTAFEFLSVRLSYFFQRFTRYVGLRFETLFTLKRGVFEPFFNTINQVFRGLTFTSIRWFQLSSGAIDNYILLLRNQFLPAYLVTFRAIANAVGPGFKKLTDGLITTLSIIGRIFKILLQVVKDFITQFSIKEVIALVTFGIVDFVDRIRNSTLDLALALNPRVFFRIFKDVGRWINKAISSLDFNKTLGYIILDTTNNLLSSFLFIVNPLAGVVSYFVGFLLELLYLEIVSNESRYRKIFSNFINNIKKSLDETNNALIKKPWNFLSNLFDSVDIESNFKVVLKSLEVFARNVYNSLTPIVTVLKNMYLRVKTAFVKLFEAPKEAYKSSTRDIVDNFLLAASYITGTPFLKSYSYVFKLLSSISKLFSQVGQNQIETSSFEKFESKLRNFKKNILIIFKDAKNKWLDFLNAFKNTPYQTFKNIESVISNFASNVISIFKEIYTKVIGNSYWTDTVEGIVKSTKNLWRRVEGNLEVFKYNFIELFRKIFNQNFSFTKETWLEAKVHIKEFSVNEKELNRSMQSAIRYLLDTIALAINTIPAMIKLVFLSLSAILVNLLFPSSKMKFALLSIILAAMSRAGFLISNELGKTVFGPELFVGVGRMVGRQLGLAIREFATNLATIVGTIGGVGAAFVRGMAEELPFFVGSFFKVLYAGFSKLGLENVFSIALLAGLAITFRRVGTFLGILGGKAGKSVTVFSVLNTVFTALNKQLDALKLTMGALFSPRLVGLIGLVISSLGGFDTIFRDSPLTKLLVQLGLLATLLSGPAWSTVVKGFQRVVLVPIGKLLRTFAPKLMANLFSSGTMVKGSLLLAAINGFNALFNNLAKRLVFPTRILGNFLSHLLLGKNPTATWGAIKTQFVGFFNEFKKMALIFNRDVSRIARNTLGAMFSSKVFNKFKGVFPTDPFNLSKATKMTPRVKALNTELSKVQDKLQASRDNSRTIREKSLLMTRLDDDYFSNLNRQKRLKGLAAAASVSPKERALQSKVDAVRKGSLVLPPEKYGNAYLPIPNTYYKNQQALRQLQAKQVPPKTNIGAALGARLGGDKGLLGKLFLTPLRSTVAATDAMTGNQGLMSRAILGPKGMAAVAAAILAGFTLFSSAARASNEELLKTTSNWDIFSSAVKSFVDSNTLIVFSAAVGAVGAAILSLVAMMAYSIKGVVSLTMPIVAIAAGIGYMFGDGLMGGIFAAMLAFPLAPVISKLINLIVGFLFKGVISAFILAGGKLTLAVIGSFLGIFTGIAAIIGAFGVLAYSWLFGDSDKSFKENVINTFKGIIDGVRSLFGVESLDSRLSKQFGITKESVDFLATIKIKPTYDLENINKSFLTAREKTGISKRIKDLQKEIDDAFEKQLAGELTEADKDILRAKVSGVDNFVNRIEARTSVNAENVKEFISTMQQNLPVTNLDNAILKRQQRQLNKDFKREETKLLTYLGVGPRFNFFGPGPVRVGRPVRLPSSMLPQVNQQLQELRESRDTEFNARWLRNQSEFDDRVIESVESIGDVQYHHTRITRDFTKSLQDYTKAREALVRFERFPSPIFNSKLAQEYQETLEKINDSLLRIEANSERIRLFNQQRKDIEDFKVKFNNMIEGFDKAGITFSLSDAILSDEDFFQLRMYAAELKRLEEMFQNTADVGERRILSQRMAVYIRDVELMKQQANILNSAVKDIYAVTGELNRVLGLDLPEGLFTENDSDFARELLEQVKVFEEYQRRLRSIDLDNIDPFGAFEERSVNQLGTFLFSPKASDFVPDDFIDRLRVLDQEEWDRLQYQILEDLRLRDERIAEIDREIAATIKKGSGRSRARIINPERNAELKTEKEKLLNSEMQQINQVVIDIRESFEGSDLGEAELKEGILRKVSEALDGSVEGISYLANKFNIDINNITRRLGIGVAQDELLSLFELSFDLDMAKSKRDLAEYFRIALEMENIINRLNKAPKKFADIVSGSATFGLSERDFQFITESELARIEIALNKIEKASDNIANKQNNFTTGDIAVYFKELAESQNAIADIYENALSRSPIQALQAIGVADNKAILRLGKDREELIRTYARLETNRRSLEYLDGEASLRTVERIAELQDKIDKILRRNDRRTFSGQLSSINSVLSSSFSEETFSGLSVALRKGLAATAGIIEDISIRVAESGGDLANNFYKAIRPLAARIKQLGVFADLSNEFANAVYRGLDEGFQKIQDNVGRLGDSFSNFEFDPEFYFKIDPATQVELENFSDMLSGLDFLARQRSLSPGLVSALSELENSDADLKEIYSKVQLQVESDLKSPIEILDETNNNLIVVIERLTHAILTGTSLPENRSSSLESNEDTETSISVDIPDMRNAIIALRELTRNFRLELLESQPDGVLKTLAITKAAGVDLEVPQAIRAGKAIEEAESRARVALDKRLEIARLLDIGASKEELQNAAIEYSQAVIEANRYIVNTLKNWEEFYEQRGQEFTKATLDDVSDTLKDAMKTGDFKLKDLATSFSHRIIDTFIDGLMDPLFNSETIQNVGKQVFEGVFGLGRKLFGSKDASEELVEESNQIPEFLRNNKPYELPEIEAFSKIKDPAAEVASENADLKEYVSQPILNGLAGVGAIVSAIGMKQNNTLLMILGFIPTIVALLGSEKVNSAISSFSGIFGIAAATGGLIRGPGTGTSDSIPSLLSNGEYVVKAASTKKFLPLIQAINNDAVQGFAEGGLISLSSINTKPVEYSANSSSSSQQVINLSITGDVSRQTRSEIMQMIPQLAGGINAYNKEINYRR